MDAHNVLSDHVPEKEKIEKDDPPHKAEDETKTLALAQAKLNGSTFFACGKNGFCASMFSQKDATKYKYWASNEKKRPKNATDSDNNAAASIIGAHCTRRAGM